MRAHQSILRGTALVLMLLAWTALAPVCAQPALTATPDLLPAGGSFQLRAAGLENVGHRAFLRQGASVAHSWPGTLQPVAGSLDVSLQIPFGFSAGEYSLVLADESSGSLVAGPRPVTVSAHIDATLMSEPAPPGATVRVRLDQLVPGELSLTWDGIRVHGPVYNASNSLELEFTSPASRPAPGAVAYLESQVNSGELLIARGGMEVPTVGPATSLPVAVQNLLIPAGPRPAGQAFTVSGQLQSRLPLPPNTRVQMVTQLPNGRVLPLSPRPAPVAPNGSFSLTAFPRGLLANAPVMLDGQLGQDRIVVSSNQGDVGMVPIGVGSYARDPNDRVVELLVRVRNTDGQPVAGAIVVLDAKLPLVPPPDSPEPPRGNAAKAPTPVNSAATQVLARPSQSRTALAELLPEDITQCPVSLARGLTNAQGEFLARIDLKLLAVFNFKVVANAGGQIFTTNKTETEIRVKVNAKPVGFTFASSSSVGKNGESSLIYSSAEGFLVYNPATKAYDQPLAEGNAAITFTARPLTAPVTLDFDLAIDQVPKIGSGANPAVFGPITTLPPGKYPGTSFQVGSDSSFRIEFEYNEALEGILTSAVLLPAAGNIPIGNFTSFDGECALYNKRYRFDLPNARELPHGDNRYRIRIRSGAQLEGIKEIALRAAPPPPWFADPAYSNRVAKWAPHAVNLSAQRSYPERQADGNPPNVGNLRNRSQATDRFAQVIQPSGHGALIKTTESRNETVNRPAPPKSGTSSDPVTVFKLNEELFDTGWIPLFRFAWGVPPIASATFGADARFWARLFIESTAKVVDGKIFTDLTTQPSIGGAINAFFNFSAALGLVDMDASFTPAFALAVTTVVKNSELKPLESQECFRFTLDVAYEVSVGWCPLCVEFGDTARVVNEQSPNGCTIKREILAAFAEHRKARAAGILQRHPPSLAFDALGAGSLAGLNASGELEIRELGNAGLGAPLNLGKARGASAPQHVYFAPGKALLVHERSSFASDSTFLAATVEQAAASRNLVWRSLSGGVWSAAQNLTPTNHGDGQVSLAVCPDGEAGCPAGGEVLAVWVRDPAGQVFGYRFEVWHAIFRNGSWTAPARVDDPGPGSDMHPRATYVGGQPLVSWVRTPTRSIAAAPQRRLMTRFLGGSFPTAEVDGAPQGVMWQDLATDTNGRVTLAFTVNPEADAFFGNHAELWFAQGQCVGGSCTWTVSQQRDANGRALRAESPSLTRAGDGSVRVAFRSLGYSPNAQGQRLFPGDSLGQVTGSGDLVALTPQLGGAPVLPQLLSSDGLVHFAPVLRRNPVTGELLSLSAIASQPLAKAGEVSEALGMALGRSQVKQLAATDGLALARFADLPDIILEEVVHTEGEFVPGGEVVVKLLLRNAGPRWTQDGNEAHVYAAWDGAPEYRRQLSLNVITSFPSSGLREVEIPVPVPPDFLPDQARELFVNINGDYALPELSLDNNLVSLRFGELAAPAELVPVVRSEDRYVFLEWQPAQDPRVVGYTVERQNLDEGEPWTAIGSSFEPAFLDLTAFPGLTYAYRVVGYSQNGFESAPSNEVLVEAAAITSSDLFKAGFEEGAPEDELVLPELP
jgi:hypothetical protein